MAHGMDVAHELVLYGRDSILPFPKICANNFPPLQKEAVNLAEKALRSVLTKYSMSF
jgi:hypothetical protein